MSSESWSRSSSSRTRYDDRKRRDRHYDDYDRDCDDRRRRRHSPDRDRHRGSAERDRHRGSADRDRHRGSAERDRHRGSADRDRHRGSAERDRRRGSSERDRRRGSSERDRRRGSSERDRYRSYDDDRDGRRRGKSSSRRHRLSRSRSRSSSYESSRRRKMHREQFRFGENKSSHSSEMTNIKILRASRSRSKSQNKMIDHHMDKWKKNYFDSFRTTNVDNNSIIGNIDESDFDREKIHKEMQERLSLHLAREGKVYPPPKPQASHPIFANDGSFLETFKKMQEQQKQQVHDHKSEPSSGATPAAQQQYQKPMFSKRRGGKILKTGIVQKTKIADESVAEEAPNDAWSLYLQEVKKYKNVSCDADSKTRPLVK